MYCLSFFILRATFIIVEILSILGWRALGSLTRAVSAGLAPHRLWIDPHRPMLPRVLTRNRDFEPSVCLVPHYLTVF